MCGQLKKGHTCAAMTDVVPVVPATKKGRKARAATDGCFAAETPEQ